MKGHGTKIIKLISTSGNTVSTKSGTEGKIGKVCYVDDSRTSAYVTKKILKEYGYEVDFFPSAEPAVVAILENDYDLLLTDLTLSTGGMDGDELVRFLRNSGHPRKKLLPVIVITGTSDKETLLKIYEAGANGVLVKPITGEELHDRIRTLVPEKAYPGSPDGYALEIPNTHGQPGSSQPIPQSISQPIPQQKLSSGYNTQNAEIDLEHNTVANKLSGTEQGANTLFDSTTGQVLATPGKSIQKKQKKVSQSSVSSTIPSKKGQGQEQSQKQVKKQIRDLQAAKVKQQQLLNVTLGNSQQLNKQSVPKQKNKKLSILENLKLAAIEQNSDLGLNQVTDFDSDIKTKKKIPLKTSKQHTQPTYKSAANKGRRKPGPKKKVNPNNNNIERPFATAPARANQFVDQLREQQEHNNHDDIPVLQPAGNIDDGLLFSIDNNGAGAPELKLQERSASVQPSVREAKPSRPQSRKQSRQQPTKRTSPKETFNSPGADSSIDRNAFDSSFGDDVTSDKKIITALDINTDFSEFDDDVFRPSFLQSIGDVFHSFKLLGLAAVVSVGIIFWSLWNYVIENEVVDVEVTRASKGTLHQTINVPGRVVSQLNINVSSSSSGQIVAVKVKEGQGVKKGKILVKLENEEAISDIKRADGNLLSAREETALANKTLKRMRRALTLGAISRQQMEEAEASLRSAQAKENVTKETRRTARLALDKLSVVAPFTGTVTSKFAQIGQWVTPSDTLFTLTDLSQREVEVKVDSADSSSLSVGQSVFMSSDSAPDNSWTESVRRIASAANKNDGTNTVSVFISLSSNSPSLRLGQQVDAEIRTFSRNNTTKLPISAVISRNGKTWVATIKDGRVHFVPIETGMEDLTHVEILSGITSMQEIVIPQGKELQEGDRVRISTSQLAE